MAVLFDHVDAHGELCRRPHHPTLPDEGEGSHDAGFDCPCTWDDQRAERERAKRGKALDEWRNSPEAEEFRLAEDRNRAAVEEWIRAHPGVAAQQTVMACPEVWQGVIDGHSFFFRERHGTWHIEIDLTPNGRYADRYVGTSGDGEMITERVELTSGETIAEGADSSLGDGPVEHLRFIVETVRTHLAQASCAHRRAERYCPECGSRIGDEP